MNFMNTQHPRPVTACVSGRWSARRRRGISLLEVLISMFIMLVGLAGIAALLPAGRSEIMQGVKLDYAMMVGRNAFRELNARGYLRPQSSPQIALPPTGTTTAVNGWFLDGTPTSAIWRPDSSPSAPFLLPAPIGSTASPAVLVDPLGHFALAPGATYGNIFPFGAPTSLPFITRISPFGTITGTNAKLLTDTIFRCEDDSVIKENKITKNGPPLRQEVPFGATGTGVMKLASAANYSWFATVVSDPGSPATGSPVRVSVAVFYKRDLSAAGAGERFCRVISLPGLGISGGEVVIFDPVTPLVKPLRPGQWVMMAGFDDSSGTRRDYFHWYKVLAASPITEVNQLPALNANPPSGVNGSSKVQPVTLAGADWGRNLFPANPATGLTVTSPTGWPTMFVVDNVIAVYEKSMNLEF